MEELQNELRELKAQVSILQKRVDANPFVFTGLYTVMDCVSSDITAGYNKLPIMVPMNMPTLTIQLHWHTHIYDDTLSVAYSKPYFTPEFGEMHFDYLHLIDISLSTPNLPYHTKRLNVKMRVEFTIGLFRGLDKFVDTEVLEISCYTKIAETVNKKLFGLIEIKPDGHVISYNQAQIFLDELFAIIKNTKIAKVTVFGNTYVVCDGRLRLQ